MEIENKEIVVSVLVVVMPLASPSGSLRGNFYLLSTSGGRHPELPVTAVLLGAKLVWRAMPVDPNDQIQIAGFGGPAVPGMVNPAPMDPAHPTTTRWSGVVTRVGIDVPYEMILTVNGQDHSAKCLLSVVEPRGEPRRSPRGAPRGERSRRK